MINELLMDLEKRNNYLKSKLLHEQLKWGNYPFKNYKKYFSLVLDDYLKSGSLFKAAQNTGIDYAVVLSWFFQGQCGDPNFESFYLVIKKINGSLEVENIPKNPEKQSDNCEGVPEEDYIISQYGDGFSYKTYIDGEKIFLIADDLESLKMKVKCRHLPLN